MDPTNRLIAALYGGVFTQPLEQFQDFALTALNAVVPYDSAAWASGQDEISTIHSMHAVNQKLDDLQLLATRYRDSDSVRQKALACPGMPVRFEDVMTVADYHAMPLYYELGQRIGIEQVMATVLIDPVTNLDNLIILWRADRARPFDDAERDAVKVVVPHVAEAWRHCQIHALLHPNRPLVEPSDAFLHGRAITDSFGRISQADPAFGGALDSVFPNWVGPQLPVEIAAFVRSDRPSLTLGVLRFSIVRGQQHHVLGVLGTAKGSRLTSAEFDVARRVVAGDSHVRIAAARSVSPATVRNQIASIYDKLEVHSKVELIGALSALLTS